MAVVHADGSRTGFYCEPSDFLITKLTISWSPAFRKFWGAFCVYLDVDVVLAIFDDVDVGAVNGLFVGLDPGWPIGCRTQNLHRETFKTSRLPLSDYFTSLVVLPELSWGYILEPGVWSRWQWHGFLEGGMGTRVTCTWASLSIPKMKSCQVLSCTAFYVRRALLPWWNSSAGWSGGRRLWRPFHGPRMRCRAKAFWELYACLWNLGNAHRTWWVKLTRS